MIHNDAVFGELTCVSSSFFILVLSFKDLPSCSGLLVFSRVPDNC